MLGRPVDDFVWTCGQWPVLGRIVEQEGAYIFDILEDVLRNIKDAGVEFTAEEVEHKARRWLVEGDLDGGIIRCDRVLDPLIHILAIRKRIVIAEHGECESNILGGEGHIVTPLGTVAQS